MELIQFRFIMRTLLWIAKAIARRNPPARELENIEKDYQGYIQSKL